ncbi:CPBP family intramembrane glutamic endopeptidase [Heyndrickxia vini]|uniref:CPBP family intramembrane metalloprotease n=1 Tax=Heyndrickxia vini TaxID=1476025 RepID=A0ABX7E1L6_9BACI|nr:CPBP family intramembrane glutamic endopeptidase [Heyndrickxia vini]QQZ09139.1 CPBP family intramembrane metalloprotease [Heyndrickxia vini]
MKKEYAYILITYIAMQLSGYVGYPIVYLIGVKGFHTSESYMKMMTPVYWIVISFISALIIVLLILRKSERKYQLERSTPLSAGKSISWAVGGIFLAFIAQTLASIIEQMIGIKPGSENTQRIVNLIETFPIVVVVSSIIGPILEEIVFRKIIFGTLNKYLSFFSSALISSVIFGLAHMEFVHLLLYSAMGFTFAFLYKKTNRILVPISAHVIMNTIVVIAQLLNREEIQKIIEKQSFIGGLFS